MKKRSLLIILYFIINFIPIYAQNEIDALLVELDKTITERPVYMEKRKSEIEQLKRILSHTDSLEEQYQLIGNIIDKYSSFICDSAEEYIYKKIDIAKRLNNRVYIQESKLQLSFVYSLSGLFTQAADILNSLSYNDLANSYLRTIYCWNYIRYYENLINYTDNSKFSTEYTKNKAAYRDTLISILPKNSDLLRKEQAFKLQEQGKYSQAYQILYPLCAGHDTTTHDYAMESMSMAKLYHSMDSGYQEKKYLILAAITDIKVAVKENEALLSLAMLVYKEGDINRAYNYVQVALDDANFYNSRFRNTVIARIQPIVENSYLYKTEQQKNNLRLLAILLGFFVITLIVALSFIYRQHRIVSKARMNLKIMNEELVGLNKNLDEANLVKEEYIGYFMNQCSIYIDKMDDYRRLINRRVKARQFDELYTFTSSTLTIDDATDELYNKFDDVFLKLYPGFIEEVNHLFKDNEKIYLKKGLNTELRILALIRLGITDTNQIAIFLRHSVQTIYNYRSKMRRKAKTDPDAFEEKVKKIGSITFQ